MYCGSERESGEEGGDGVTHFYSAVVARRRNANASPTSLWVREKTFPRVRAFVSKNASYVPITLVSWRVFLSPCSFLAIISRAGKPVQQVQTIQSRISPPIKAFCRILARLLRTFCLASGFEESITSFE